MSAPETGAPPAPAATASRPAAIAASGLRKSYGAVVAVAGVDLHVEAGTIHGLLGPNGAGKTTVLAMLLGLVPPDGGHLEVLGRRSGGRPGDLAGVGGFVEAPRFYPYLDARANLLGLSALDGHADAALVDRLLVEVGLGGGDGQKVRGFSLGMRQRLGLAAALLRRPSLLIVDEPANGLDPAGMRDLRALLRRLAAGGMTVLLSSHDMPTVEDLCDRVTVMRGGRVAFDGTMDAMRAQAPDPAFRVRTSDDEAALVSAGRLGLRAARHDDGGLSVHGAQHDIDTWVLELGRAGTAVRSMVLAVTPLESLFFMLTEGSSPGGAPSRPEGAPAGPDEGAP